MQRGEQLAILDRIMAHRAAGNTTDMVPAMYQNPVDAYTDPWGQDGKEPATPGQFRSSLPLVALPKVPVR